MAQFLAVANLFRVQIFMAHFDYVCDVMMTKLLGLASELMAAEMIFKKKDHCFPSAKDGQFADGIGVNLRRKIRSFRLQFVGAGPYCCSNAPVFLNPIRLANLLFK